MKAQILIVGSLFVCLLGCSHTNTPFRSFCGTDISSVVISARIDGTNAVSDWQEQEIANYELIKDLFTDYLRKTKREPVKFFPYYKIEFDSKDEHYVVFVSGYNIKFNGVSYICHKNIGKFIRTMLIGIP